MQQHYPSPQPPPSPSALSTLGRPPLSPSTPKRDTLTLSPQSLRGTGGLPIVQICARIKTVIRVMAVYTWLYVFRT